MIKKRFAKAALWAASRGGPGGGWSRRPAPAPTVDPAGVKSVLLWTMNALGDVVRMTPAIEAMRGRFSGARFTMVATPRAAPILYENPHIDEHVLLKRPYALGDHRAVVDQLRDRPWDLAVLLEVNPDWVALEARWMRALRVRHTYALDFGRGVPRSVRAVPMTAQGSWIVQFNRLADATGAATTNQSTRVYLSAEERRWAASFLSDSGVAENQRFAVVHAGGNFRSVSRQWAPERFAEVVREMRARWGIVTVLTGVEAERPTIERVASLAGNPLVNLCGRLSMRQLAAVLDRAGLCVMNDTGPLHIAHALGRPSVAILGPTGAEVVGVPPTGSVVRADLPCSPCAHFTGWKACTNPKRWECLSAVTPGQVLAAIERRLDGAVPLPVIGSPAT